MRAVAPEKTGIAPTVSCSKIGTIQRGDEVKVTVTYQTNIELISGFSSVRITLRQMQQEKARCY